MASVDLKIVMSAVGGAGITSMVGQIASAFNGKNGMTNGLKAVGLAAAAMGVTTAIALGVQAVQAAGTFQESMTQLVTGAGELQSNLGLVSNGILNLAVSTGTSTQQLSQGMYMIESAGYHGAAGLNVLQVAAQGAKVGNADLEAVANSLTTVLTDYHMSANQAASAMNGLTTTVASGKTHLQDLASSMGTVLPLASSLGVSFPQVAGALATMTNAGMDARRASMNLANAIRSLGAPSSTAEKSMASVGLTAQQLKNTLSTQGLTGVIQEVSDAVGKRFPAGSVQAVTAFKNIMGGATGYNVALMLGGKNMQAFQSNVNAVSGAMQHGGSTVKGWSQVQQDFNFKMSQGKEMLETTSIKIGTALLPAVTKLIGGLMTLGTWIGNVANFFAKNQVVMDALKAVLLAVGVVILTTVVPAFIAWAISMIPVVVEAMLLAAPFVLATIIIAAVIFGVIEVIQHWGAIVQWLKNVWSGIVNFFKELWLGIRITLQILANFFSGIWHDITTGVGNFFSMIGTLVQNGLQAILNFFLAPFRAIGKLFEWLYAHNIYFQRLVDAIRKIIGDVIAFLKRVWTNIVNEITGLWHGLVTTATNVWNTITGAIHTAWNAVVGVVTSVWQKISSVFTNAWTNYVSKPVSTLWSNVTGAFGNAWNTISQKLSSLWSSISGWFGNIANQAIQWGANLISGFLKGVQNAISGIGKTLGNVGSSIASYLGFHSPTKEGPGRDADKWAPNLMKMYAQGLQAGIPQLQASLNMVMRPVVGTLTGGVVPTSGVARPSTNITHAPSITINLSTMARSQSEVRNMVDLFEQELGRRMRSQTPSYNSANVF